MLLEVERLEHEHLGRAEPVEGFDTIMLFKRSAGKHKKSTVSGNEKNEGWVVLKKYTAGRESVAYKESSINMLFDLKNSSGMFRLLLLTRWPTSVSKWLSRVPRHYLKRPISATSDLPDRPGRGRAVCRSKCRFQRPGRIRSRRRNGSRH